ncbi:ATP-binding protein [Acinetobacter guillouiae]|uniref:ATP-binding protein n=2 Tax=Acinetobacter guillouiae TaxID=106649 RepID=UPI003AF599E0
MTLVMWEISEKEVVTRMNFDNPWWVEGKDSKIIFENSPRRNYFDKFYSNITNREVTRAVILMGPRRVGKTVMIRQSIRKLLDDGIDSKFILYLSLETPIYTGLSLEKIVILFQKENNLKRDSKVYIFFDEIQYLKDWEVHLKSLVDSFPDYKFIATGSAAAALKLKSNESGAGRFSDFPLPPLTFAEYLKFIEREDLVYTNDRYKWYETDNIVELNKEFVNYLNFGGYPEAVLNETIRSDPGQYIKNDIIDKVLLRDLPSLYGILDIQELNRLFTTIAYNSGNEISLESLTKSSGVAKNTVKKYLEYLAAAFLITIVHRIDDNCKKFKRATNFKVYLTNPSMRAALFGPVKEDDNQVMGSLVETAIFSQWVHWEARSLFYARWDNKGGEIDVVSVDDAFFQPEWIVEVKWTDRMEKDISLLENSVYFMNKNDVSVRRCVMTSKTFVKDIIFKDINFEIIPASIYVYTVGKNLLFFDK